MNGLGGGRRGDSYSRHSESYSTVGGAGGIESIMSVAKMFI